MTAPALADGEPPLDLDARRTLAWGAGLLVVGVALVGVGAEKVGATPVLAGLLLTILGIHTYGRLGPEGELDAPPRRGAANVWRGAMVATAGGAVVVGGAPEGLAAVMAWGAALAGVVVLLRGLRATPAGKAEPARGVPTKPRKVEKRRRLDKSPPP